MGVVNQNDINDIINANIEASEAIIKSVSDSVANIVNDKNARALVKNAKMFSDLCGFVKDYTSSAAQMIKQISTDNTLNAEVKEVVTYVETHKQDVDKLAVLVGDDKKGGLVSAVTKLGEAIGKINSFKFTWKDSIAFKSSVKRIKKAVSQMVNLIKDDVFAELEDKNLKEKLKNANETIKAIGEIFSSVVSMIKHSVMIMLFGWVVRIALKVINGLVKAVLRVATKKVSKKHAQNFENLKVIIESLYKIMLKLTIMIPLSITGTIGIIVASLFVIALCGFVMILGLLLRFINRFIRKMRRGLKRILWAVSSLMLIGVALLLFAVAVPIIVKALTDYIMPFIGILLISMVVLWLVLWLTKKFVSQARKNALKIALNILIMVGIFLIIAVVLYVAAIVGKKLQEDGVIMSIIIGLIALIVVSLLIIALGKIISKAAPQLTATTAALVPLIIVIGLIVVAAMLLPLLAYVGRKIQEEDAITNMVIGLIALIIFSTIIVLLGMALSYAAPFLTATIASITPLLIVVGLLVASALLMLTLAWVGKKIQEEDAITNIIIGVTATIVFSAIVVGLGIALSFAAPFLTLTMGTVGILFAVIALLVGAAALLLALGAIGKEMVEADTMTNAKACIKNVISIAWDLAKSGPKMLLALVTLPITMVAILTMLPVLGLTIAAAALLVALANVSETLDMEKVKQTVKNVFSFIGIFNSAAGKYNFWDMIKIIRNLPILVVVTLIAGLMTSVAEKLNYIQEIELKADKITEHVNFIFTFIKTLQAKVSDILSDNEGGGNWFTRWKRRRAAARRHAELVTKLNRVDRIVGQITGIAESLQSIQNISLDTQKITDNVNFIFSFITTLENLIKTNLENTTAFEDNVVWVWKSKWYGGYWEKEVRENASVEKLNKVDKVVSGIKNIAESLKLLQQITINKSKIEENVNYIFDFIDELAKILETRLASVTAFDDDVKWVWVKGGWFSRGYWKEERTENQAAKKLNKIQEVMSSIGSIMDTLKGLGEFTIDDKFKATVKNNIDNLFSFIDELALKVDEVMNPKTNAKWGEWDADYMRRLQVKNVISSDEFSKMGDNFGNVGKVVQTLADMSDSIKKLTKFKITAKDKQKIEDAISTLFNASTFIIQKTEENLKKANGASIYDSLNPYIEGISKLNEGFDALSQVDGKTFRKNTESFGDFITKVNKVNVEKVERTAYLFEKMSELTKEMKGDFGLLAEALTDKLLPVLEELKAVMQDVPEKLEEGFSNTSASIAATSAPPTRDNVAAQVEREKPNMSKEEIDKLVEKRLKERAKIDANSITSKIDELISMFKGRGGSIPMVKAI